MELENNQTTTVTKWLHAQIWGKQLQDNSQEITAFYKPALQIEKGQKISE